MEKIILKLNFQDKNLQIYLSTSLLDLIRSMKIPSGSFESKTDPQSISRSDFVAQF